jgi:hypothetical protein
LFCSEPGMTVAPLQPKSLSRNQVLPYAPEVRQQRIQSQKRHQEVFFETSIKLGFMTIGVVLAGLTLTQLFQNWQTRQARLSEMQAELQLTEGRVKRLHKDFFELFSPQQSTNLISGQHQWVRPYQRRVVWLDPKANQ